MTQPNEKQHESGAAKQRAYRERKARGEVQARTPEPPPAPTPRPPVPEPPEPQPRPPIPPPTPCPPVVDIEVYVQDALLGAELAYAQTSLGANMSTKTLAETLDRAEQYARWRYAGVVAGEINGL